jgi:hypothetical protein
LQGAAGPQGAQGDAGPRGLTGDTGASGFSPTITVSENNPRAYTLQVTNADGSFLTPNLRQASIDGVTGADLSAAGSTMSIPVGNMVYTVSRQDANSVNVRLSAASGSVLADVKKFSQYNANTIDAASYDSTTFTTTPVTIDTVVYNDSNEFHVTRIRQQDPVTGLWSIYDVNLLTSANGARTNVWVQQIATGLTY